MTHRPDLSRSHPLGIRRDGDALASFVPGMPHSRWSRHARIDHAQSHLPSRYLVLRDTVPKSNVVMEAMRKHCPRAAQILDSYLGGELTTREAAFKADGEYQAALADWRERYLGSAQARSSVRTDADSVWLQSETVHFLSRVLSARYAAPTIFNVIPTEVLGTPLTTYQQFTEDETDEVAVIGDTFEPMGTPGSDAERGEIFRKLMFYKYGANWSDRDLEIEAAVRANGRGPAWSLIDKKTAGARRAMDTQRAYIAAFGQYSTLGIPGLLFGSEPANLAEESEFAGADPEVNVNNILAMIAEQSAAVNYREDRVADTLAMDPASYEHLGRQMWSDGVTTPGETALENLMRRARSIKKIVPAAEFRSQGAAAVTKIESKGIDAAMASRLAGGILKEGEQRSVAMIYKDDADVFAHVVGRQLEVKTWPDHYGKHSTVMRESSGGVVFFEPAAVKMIFRPVAGDATL